MLPLSVIAAFYGATNEITIMRGFIVPEMISRGCLWGNQRRTRRSHKVTLAIAPLAAAWIWSETGGYDAVLVAIGIGAIVLYVGFWTAAVLSRLR